MKQNYCSICGEPCSGDYIADAVVSHGACAYKAMEPVRRKLCEEKESRIVKARAASSRSSCESEKAKGTSS